MKRAGEIGIRREAAPGEELRPIPKELLSELWKVVAYLCRCSEYAPDWPKMGEDDRKAYVVGYAAPLHDAGVEAVDLMPAARLWLTRHTEYPKAPLRLIECCRLVKIDRMKVENAQAPVLNMRNGEPPVSPETRRAVRQRLGLDAGL